MTDTSSNKEEAKPYNPGRNKKHQSRCLVVQALYGWQLHPGSREQLIESVISAADFKYSKTYFNTLLHGVLDEIDKIDEILTAAVDRPLADLSPIEFAVMRLAVFEWLHCPEVPTKVVLNEALEITKEFGVQDGYKYVNAILDKLQYKLRSN